VQHALPDGDLSLAAVVQHRGRQQRRVAGRTIADAPHDDDAVLLVTQRHRLEQPLLGLAEAAVGVDALQYRNARAQRAEELADAMPGGGDQPTPVNRRTSQPTDGPRMSASGL